MSSGHRHNSSAASQNVGNTLGDRSCVRQSKLYRMYESGNGVKSLLGSSHLAWDPNEKEGAYKGQRVYDHTQDGIASGALHGAKSRVSNSEYPATGMRGIINGDNYGGQINDPYARTNGDYGNRPQDNNSSYGGGDSGYRNNTNGRKKYEDDEDEVAAYNQTYSKPQPGGGARRNEAYGGRSSYPDENDYPQQQQQQQYRPQVKSLRQASSQEPTSYTQQQGVYGNDNYGSSAGGGNNKYRSMKDQLQRDSQANNNSRERRYSIDGSNDDGTSLPGLGNGSGRDGNSSMVSYGRKSSNSTYSANNHSAAASHGDTTDDYPSNSHHKSTRPW